MRNLTVEQASRNLEELIEALAETQTPVEITGGRHAGVLVPAALWSGVQETLRLLAIPGMHQSIREGLRTPLAECTTELEW